MKTSKRILSVTIKRIVDTDPDTSNYGEYSDKPSEFYIDRAHKSDCPSFLPDGSATEARDCSCIGDDWWDRREYRYFNVSSNYEGDSAEDIRKYLLQDYERMESYNNQNWCYLGLRASCDIVLKSWGKWDNDTQMFSGGCGPIQTITSGGLSGIESDSDKSDFEEIEQEELAELREQLKALGFSARAISTAFKDIKHKSE